MTFSSVRRVRVVLNAVMAVLCTAGMLTTQQALAASWTPAKILSTYTLLALPTNNASVAVSGNGDAVAVWINETDYTVQYAKRTLGVWSAARVLYRPSSLNAETTADAQVVMAPDGSALAIFASTTPGKLQYCVAGNRVYRCLGPSSSYAKVAKLAVGSTAWTKPAAVSAKGIVVANTRVGVDATGNALAAWTYVEKAGALTQLQSATATLGAAWSAPATLLGGNISMPQLAVDAAGDAAITWQERNADNSGYHLRLMRMSAGVAGEVVDMAALSSAVASLRAGIDDAGTVTAVWNAGYGMNLVHCFNGAGCDVPAALSSTAGVVYGTDAYAYMPDIAVAGNGDVLVAWTEMNAATGEWFVVGQMQRGVDVITSFQELVDGQLGVPMADVEFGRDGTAAMVGWVDYGSGAVQVNRWEPASGWINSAIGSAVWGSQVVLGSGPNAQGSAVWIANTATEFRYRVMAGSVVF